MMAGEQRLTSDTMSRVRWRPDGPASACPASMSAIRPSVFFFGGGGGAVTAAAVPTASSFVLTGTCERELRIDACSTRPRDIKGILLPAVYQRRDGPDIPAISCTRGRGVDGRVRRHTRKRLRLRTRRGEPPRATCAWLPPGSRARWPTLPRRRRPAPARAAVGGEAW